MDGDAPVHWAILAYIVPFCNSHLSTFSWQLHPTAVPFYNSCLSTFSWRLHHTIVPFCDLCLSTFSWWLHPTTVPFCDSEPVPELPQFKVVFTWSAGRTNATGALHFVLSWWGPTRLQMVHPAVWFISRYLTGSHQQKVLDRIASTPMGYHHT